LIPQIPENILTNHQINETFLTFYMYYYLSGIKRLIQKIFYKFKNSLK